MLFLCFSGYGWCYQFPPILGLGKEGRVQL